MGKKIIVRVPATSANLGPGYDCLGLALSLCSEFTFEESGELLIEGCPAEYQNEDNLVLRAFRETFLRAGKKAPAVHLVIRAEVPAARGLGSSSTCIAAGALAANLFLGEPFDKAELLNICTALEGHPDNAAPAVYGGLCASFTEGGRAYSLPFACDAAWRFVTIIPDYEVKTEEARRAVRKEVALSDSVYTTSHALAVVRAFADGNEALIGLACRDILHEPYRKALIKEYDAVRALSFSHGAAAFFISGSGSTMIALAKGDAAARQIAGAARTAFPAFTVKVLCINARGAEAEVSGAE